MFTTPRSFAGRLATTAIVALPFALIACGGGDKSVVKVANATTPDSFKPVPTSPPLEKPPVTMEGEVVLPSFKTAEAAFKAGAYRDAKELYKIRSEYPNADAQVFYMLGLSSWKAGDFDGAKDAFDRSIQLDSTFAKSYFNEARVLLDLKRAPEALELIEKGRVIDSTSQDGLRLKARAQSEKGDVSGATATYQELIMRDDADGWTLNNFGAMLMDHGLFQDAVGPLTRAVQVRPSAPLFQNNLGMALERTGSKVAALHHYEEAVRDDSTFTKAVRNVARLKGLITDTTQVQEVDVTGLAEQFRQTVRAWRDSLKAGVTPPPTQR
jgi:tetratricopeptide (TPR) repeat protein